MAGFDLKKIGGRNALIGGVAALAVLGGGAFAFSTGMFSGGSTAEVGGAALNFDLMPVAYGDKCGYVDSKGKLVVNPQFDRAGFFTARGAAPVRVGGKWGLIDRKGTYLINPQFDDMRPIGDKGQYQVRMGQNWGVVDAKGTYLVNPQFADMSPFDDKGRALVRSGDKVGLVDAKGAFLIAPQFDSLSPKADDYGNLVYFSQGLAPASVDGKWGFVDEKGAWVVNPQFVQAGHFGPNGLAPVTMVITKEVPVEPDPWIEQTRANYMEAIRQAEEMGNSSLAQAYRDAMPAEQPKTRTEESNAVAFVDKTGKIVVPAQFDQAQPFDESGLAAVLVDGKWGFIDAKGAFKINPQFASVGEFVRAGGGWRARAATQSDGGDFRWGVIDETGTFKINPQYEQLSDFDSAGLAPAGVGGKWGLIDAAGKYVINPMYDGLVALPGARNYLYQQNLNGVQQTGWVDRSGKVLSTVSGEICA